MNLHNSHKRHTRESLSHPGAPLSHPGAACAMTRARVERTLNSRETPIRRTDTSDRAAYARSEVSGMTNGRVGMKRESAVAPRLPAACPRTVGNIRRKCGFTLIEVMIALLVITLGMGAVIVTTGESGWKSSYLRESTIASWVAYNEIAMYRAKRTWSDATSRSGESEMANAQWNWQMKISATDDPLIRRVDVEVFIKGETAVKSRVTGFIARL